LPSHFAYDERSSARAGAFVAEFESDIAAIIGDRGSRGMRPGAQPSERRISPRRGLASIGALGMNTHLYKIDQNVLLADRAGANLKQAAVYRIVATLPARDAGPQYRVKGEHERFERMVEESQITAVALTEPPATADDGAPASARLESPFGSVDARGQA